MVPGLDCSLFIREVDVWGVWLEEHPVVFIMLYLFNIMLYLSFYINIALIWIRKYKNLIPAVISSFLTIMGIELFLEEVIHKSTLFNIINFFRFNTYAGLGNLLLFGIACCLISWVFVYISYRNKEKLYLDIHK